jgi:selenide,water dikinase
MGPEDLAEILRSISPSQRSELLVGLETPDDAAVYQLADGATLVHTVDFFTPIVDSPYLFGQIAAANALSDIYAMGGRPISAMNILCYPCQLGREIAMEILRGGNDKVKGAGAVVIGGHTVEDEEPKYGLAVTGLIENRQVLTSGGAGPGDILLLTKPLGTGILSTALKADFICEEEMEEAIQGMATLNDVASTVAQEFSASACTDVTGFGLLGHLYNMVQAPNLSCELYSEAIPFYSLARDMAEQGMLPAGAHNNRLFLEHKNAFQHQVDDLTLDLLCDPQTSGGLLIAIPEKLSDPALKRLKDLNPTGGYIIGRFKKRTTWPMEIR